MATNMRIKVRVEDLIARIEKAKTEAETAYDKAVAKYEAAEATWRVKVATRLEQALTEVKAGGDLPHIDKRYLDSRYRSVLHIPAPQGAPETPCKPNTKQFTRDINLLRMSSDEVLSIGADNDRFARYL